MQTKYRQEICTLYRWSAKYQAFFFSFYFILNYCFVFSLSKIYICALPQPIWAIMSILYLTQKRYNVHSYIDHTNVGVIEKYNLSNWINVIFWNQVFLKVVSCQVLKCCYKTPPLFCIVFLFLPEKRGLTFIFLQG